MKKKEAILKVATVLFANQGFADTSVQEISHLSGVAEGTIFYHYHSKEQLLLSILRQTKDSIVHQFDEFVQGRKFDSGMHMVEEMVSFYLYLAGLMEDQFLLLHQRFLYKCSETNAEFRVCLEEIYNCLTDIFEKAIVVGQRDESVCAEAHPRKSALVLFTMVDGLVRFKNYNLYDAGALFNELMRSCRRMLQGSAG
ncbi:MAG: TetR/AcrR family transcriptional regulator [Desulfovibrio sp.]|uniref:TetR/AcrR family transcriptional regulator n=1 Tax=Desulfovibrio sp. 7SRBS1 TaxID=3378064 RepID=UPI003B3E1C2B